MTEKELITAEQTLTSTQIGTISCLLAEKIGISPIMAYKQFVESKTYMRLKDPATKLDHYGDRYIVNEFLREKGLVLPN